MRNPRFLFALALLAAAPAFAFNHQAIVPPITVGPYNVACSNIAQDASRVIAGATAEDYWEGHLVNDQLLYVKQLLSAPETAIVFDAIPPDDRSIYPNTANTRVPFVAIVCHPTPDSNLDPDYALPGSPYLVPHMQAAGAAPKLIPDTRFPMIVYSHGLGGSPIGRGYIESMVALASNGYVVSAVFHADNRFSRVRVNDLSDFFYLLTQYDRVAEMELMRPVALKAMTDVLLAHRYFAAAIDTSRIAGFGASLGGQAIASLMGAKMTTSIGGACRETVRDSRIKVGVGYVPYAGQVFLPAFCGNQSGADEVTRPYLAIAGTADTTAPLSCVKEAVHHFKGTKYLVELVDGQHELRPEDIGDLFTWMVTFYKAYLEEQPAAYASLFRMKGVTGGRDDSVTIDVHVPTNFASGELKVTELHNDVIDRYFLEPNPTDLNAILSGSAGPGWSATGYAFKALSSPPPVHASLCHSDLGVETAGGVVRECGYTKRLGRWMLVDDGGFFIESANADGTCPDGLLQVNRAFNPRLALSRTVSSVRSVTSDSAARDMAANGWVLLPATMCARH